MLTVLGMLIFLAANAPPDLTGIAALITAGIGVVGFLATLVRGRNNDKRVQEVERAASVVQGFDALIKRLQEEIEEIRQEQAEERARWQAEKQALLETIQDLRSDNATTRAELMELRGQIRGFLTKEQYEEFTKHL